MPEIACTKSTDEKEGERDAPLQLSGRGEGRGRTRQAPARHVDLAPGMESMENLGMMPRRASPRPPWRVAPAWRGSSEFERCVHDADRSPEVCR